VTAFAVTILAQLMLMFVAPPAQLMPFLRDTIGTAIFDGVIAMPFYLLLKRLLGAPSR
jgi:hypothetical protein